MTITDIEELAFRLQGIVYFYMWPFPVKLDYEKEKLELNKRSVGWIPIICTVVFIFMFGWTCLGVSIYCKCINPQKNFERVNFAILVLTRACFSTIWVFTYRGLEHKYALVSVFNELVWMSDEIKRGKLLSYIFGKMVKASNMLPY